MTMVDLEPATTRLAGLLDGVQDLDGPTPCAGTSVAALLDHIDGLSGAFTGAAAKDLEAGSGAPSPDAANLVPDWRQRIPRRLGALAVAWRDPAAWTGMTRAGGVDLPGEVAGIVALNEVVVHGWDLARATGQSYDVDADSIAACRTFVDQFSGPGQEASRDGLFGPVVAVPDDASALDLLIGLTGRHPDWTPTG
jgi:uncharacterized protein (TIGR03086 family)